MAKTYFPTTNAARYLQYQYIIANPHPIDNKKLLDDPKDGSNYSEVHQKFHPFFRGLVERFHFNNLALIDSDTGNIIYSVKKSTGFGTNVEKGPLANSTLATLFDQLRQGNLRSFKISDFAPFTPNYGQPTALIGSPIFDGSVIIGVLVLDLPIDEINRIMTSNYQWEAEGMGKTGETILVGSDGLMRSQSRFLVEEPEKYFQELQAEGVSQKTLERIRKSQSPILLQKIDTVSVQRALDGETGTGFLKDYRDIPSFVSYSPLNLEEHLDWIIIAKIYASEVFIPIRDSRRKVLATVVILVLAITLLSLFISRRLVRPIYTLIGGTRKIAAGETDVTVEVFSRDEYYQLAGCFNRMARNLDAQRQSLEAQIQENEQLLRKILPAPVVKRLQSGEKDIYDSFDVATILYAHIDGFDCVCQTLSADEVIVWLNQLVSTLEETAERYSVETISCVGGIYVGASGLFFPRLDRNKCAVDLALESLKIVRRFSQERNINATLRIGIHTGSVIGGLLGKTNFSYTLLGNTVNIARILQIQCQPDTIVVTQQIYDSLQDIYKFLSLGEIEIPEMGRLPIWAVKE